MKHNDRTDLKQCDKCRDDILSSKSIVTVVLPNGRTRHFHDKCMPKEDMKVLKKDAGSGGPKPL